MSVVGAALVLAVIIVVMMRLKVARASVVIVCVLFGLVLGSPPLGPAVNRALQDLGGWTSAQLARL